MNRIALCFVVILLTAGCATSPVGGAGSVAWNVYRPEPQLPRDVHRIAVLPVVVDRADATVEDGRDDLEPVLYAELRKRAAADLVIVTREQLRDWTGREDWTTAEPLPRDFFERLTAETGCDALVFCRLSEFRAYPAVAVGWNIQLVDSRKHTLWAVDQVFDAGNPAVAAAAKRYYAHDLREPGVYDPSTILLSPRRFGQFAAAQVAATLPGR